MSEVRRKTFRFEEPDFGDSALRAQVLQRCRRSIDHDLKNAIQALHSGLEVLSRTLQSPASRKISPLECIPLLQQQLAGLHAKLDALLDEVAPEPAEPAEFDLVQLLGELLRFLNNEAAVVDAQLRLPSQAVVRARKSLIRRVLLACVLDALDSVESAGSLHFAIAQADAGVTLELRVVAPATPAFDTAPMLWRILEQIMSSENLSIAFDHGGDGYAVKMLLPAAATAGVGNASRPHAASATLARDEAGVSAAENALRVLVVDDNRDAADSLALLLELEGHGAKSAYTGEQALALVDEYRPALVLLDIGLPDMSGDAVARRIRESARSQPVLVSVSGYDRGTRRSATAPFSFDAELVKPVELPALQKLLANLPAQ